MAATLKNLLLCLMQVRKLDKSTCTLSVSKLRFSLVEYYERDDITKL
jgi:hypothetical protein